MTLLQDIIAESESYDESRKKTIAEMAENRVHRRDVAFRRKRVADTPYTDMVTATRVYRPAVYASCAMPIMPTGMEAYDSYNESLIHPFTLGQVASSPERRKEHKQAEQKARNLLKTIIGDEQSKVYNKTIRLILKPSKWFWVIGNLETSYHEGNPFILKPDVIRIDNAEKLHFTSFCVDQKGGPTPYTDKVIAFAVSLMNDEKAFKKTINRITENTLMEMPECAIWK